MAQNSYLIEVADTIREQIIAGVGINVYWSWGVSNVGAAYFKGEPSLLLAVNGLLHKGLVVITLDDSDTYSIRLFDSQGKEVSCTTDVYCEEIGSLLDSLVERKAEWTEQEYSAELAKLPANEQPFDNVEINVLDGVGTLVSISNF